MLSLLIRRLIKNISGEARDKPRQQQQQAAQPPAAPPAAAKNNGYGQLDLQADNGLLDLDAHDGDLLAHVRNNPNPEPY